MCRSLKEARTTNCPTPGPMHHWTCKPAKHRPRSKCAPRPTGIAHDSSKKPSNRPTSTRDIDDKTKDDGQRRVEENPYVAIGRFCTCSFQTMNSHIQNSKQTRHIPEPTYVLAPFAHCRSTLTQPDLAVVTPRNVTETTQNVDASSVSPGMECPSWSHLANECRLDLRPYLLRIDRSASRIFRSLQPHACNGTRRHTHGQMGTLL